MPLNDVTVARSNSKYHTTMSEVQENSVLSSQSGDTIDSLTQDANGELVMSKSKARSLRRKRAKQRKQLEKNGEKKAEKSQEKENDAAPLAQESQAAKKKKRSRKKTTTNGVEQPKTAAQNGIPKAKTEVEKPKPENSSKTDITTTVKKISPVMKEPTADSVETVPTSVYEDDNEHKDRTKEDCDCACIIS